MLETEYMCVFPGCLLLDLVLRLMSYQAAENDRRKSDNSNINFNTRAITTA